MPFDPAQWSWARLSAVSGAWVVLVAAVSVALFVRAMERAKETNVSGGQFISQIPFGTRHLALAAAIALLPPLVALLRKALAG